VLDFATVSKDLSLLHHTQAFFLSTSDFNSC